MVAIDEKLMRWPSRNSLYNVAGSFGRSRRAGIASSLQTHWAGYVRRSRLADGQNSSAIFIHVISWQPLGDKGRRCAARRLRSLPIGWARRRQAKAEAIN